MFHKLRYSVTFPTTGRTLSADVNFDTGFTAIVGPNEAGKTMILEIGKYLLWGTDALRHKVEDYKSLKADGEVTIRGVRYEIDRNIRTATLKRDGVVIAKGTTDVNEKIRSLFGYGLNVFNIANSIDQGEVEALGKMTAGQRRRMIDSVVGLDVLEVVTKWATDEARVLDKEADAIEEGLMVPGEKPTEPENYADPTAARSMVGGYTLDVAELNQLRGWLAVERTEPVKPTTDLPPVSELEGLAAARGSLRNRLAAIGAGIAARPAQAPYNTLQLDDAESEWGRWDRYQEAQAWLRQNPEATMTLAQVAEHLRAYEALDSEAERMRIQTQIDIISGGRLECPKCHHRWGAEEDLRTLNNSMPEKNTPAFDPRTVSRSELTRQEALNDPEIEATRRKMQAVEALDKPRLDRNTIPKMRQMIVEAAERKKLEEEAVPVAREFEAMPDYEMQLIERKAFDAALATYEIEAADYLAWIEERKQKQQRATALEGVEAHLAAWQEMLRVSEQYDRDYKTWDDATLRWTAGQTRIKELRDQAVEYRKGKDAVLILRGMVKQHLVPSLNVVASHLLERMTGGQRRLVVVDEEFEVTVDGQPLATLSGSGKAVVNLALRIGLGQVLTNRIFSVLMADEIDASMDKLRAQNTADVLLTLVNSISQVLLVSHKPVEAEHRIELGAEYADAGRAEEGL